MNHKIPHLSIVIPVYGCSTSLYELYHRTISAIKTITENYEIIFINDSSPDEAWNIIMQLCEKDEHVIGINLSRNFGQHYSIAAGLDFSSGEWIVVMDCDLQDRPEEIPRLYSKALEGWDVVLAQRIKRKDPFLKQFFSKLFYAILGYLTETKQDSKIANFGIYHRKVIEAISSMGDALRYFPTMVRWVGFRQTAIEVEHAERKDGKTSYSFKKLLHLGLDVILAFSDKPLRLTVKVGILISTFAFIMAIFIFVMHLLDQIKVTGWTSLIISIWLLGGVIIFIIGIVGLYIGKTFENVKNRPRYIVSDCLNCPKKDESIL